MVTGLYALASLNGAPIDRDDAARLGLDAEQTPGLMLRVEDAELQGRAVSMATGNGEILALLGHFDEPDELARALGRPREETPAGLALHALRRWDMEASAHMAGEWSLLHWNSARRELTLGVSATLRDTVAVAYDGARVAVAPQPFQLSRLAGVGRAFDPEGLPLSLALSAAGVHLRMQIQKDRTVLKNVRMLEPGTFRRFSGHGQICQAAPQRALPPAFTGSFEEAAASLEQTARQIMRRALARHDTVAILLSGGLDSSILAWLAAEERRAGQQIVCISSVAADGSNLRDERAHARCVADRLGLPIVFVTPPAEDNPYRPSLQTIEQFQAPPKSPRHYLYERLYEAASRAGADGLIDGVWGESSVTRFAQFRDLNTGLKAYKRHIRGWIDNKRLFRQASSLATDFPPLADGALKTLPPVFFGRRADMPWPKLYRSGEPLGWTHEMQFLSARTTTALVHTGLRKIYPYRDRGLTQLAAAMPAGFTFRDGLSRAFARAMLKDRLPDSIRLRTDRVPFSPDYVTRLQQFAPTIQERLAVFYEAGAGEWLDIAWLAEAARQAAGRKMSIPQQFQLQVTALAAEFFVGWGQMA